MVQMMVHYCWSTLGSFCDPAICKFPKKKNLTHSCNKFIPQGEVVFFSSCFKMKVFKQDSRFSTNYLNSDFFFFILHSSSIFLPRWLNFDPSSPGQFILFYRIGIEPNLTPKFKQFWSSWNREKYFC